ncbi:MAG: glycerophosphodiester phosphodiesterase family protein [Nanoarchaeota archaeon]
MNKTLIFTHRGLEPSNENFFFESSYEAFKNHLEREFGIEFDPNFTKDNIIVWHDSTLKRITQGKDERNFSDVLFFEIANINISNGKISSFAEILDLIKNSKAKLHALHLKAINQTREKIDKLLELIRKRGVIDLILLFDVKPEWARYIKSKIPQIKIAPSVALDYDIKRYGKMTGDTLISIEDALKFKEEGIYDWVWLDEWDRIDENGQDKKLYTKEVFLKLKNIGYKIALVTPELHGTSPGLLGGEAHSDAKNKESLFKRINEIIELNPDAICTDYPEEVRKIFKG